MNQKQATRDYYRTSQWLYRVFYYNLETLAMHHGFWEPGVRNLQEALQRENQAVIDIGKIKKNERVLDAGCGVGGTAIFIAQKTGANVTGITIEPRQAKLARKYASQKKIHHLTTFQTQDYTQTNFPADYFAVVYGIESVCCASPKSTFLNEAMRILKPGGRLVILDGYASRKPANNKEKKIIEDFKPAFALEEFITPQQMTDQIKAAGFTNVRAWSKLDQVEPSIKHYTRLRKFLYPITKLLSYFPIDYLQAAQRNSIALLCIEKAHKLGLAEYYIHSPQKPEIEAPRANSPRIL